MLSYLNIASYIPRTAVLGPGIRSVIWVQGCPFNCSGCIAPEWIINKTAHLIPIEEMAQQLLSVHDSTGLTISGGEPMTQAFGLSNLLRIIRKEKDLDVICFTGFKIEDLVKMPPNKEINEFLSMIDLLIDGPYIASLNDNKGLRGSANQRFHYLSTRIKSGTLENAPRKVEYAISTGSISLIGVPDKTSLQAFETFMNKIEPGEIYERPQKSLNAS